MKCYPSITLVLTILPFIFSYQWPIKKNCFIFAFFQCRFVWKPRMRRASSQEHPVYRFLGRQRYDAISLCRSRWSCKLCQDASRVRSRDSSSWQVSEMLCSSGCRKQQGRRLKALAGEMWVRNYKFPWRTWKNTTALRCVIYKHKGKTSYILF